MTIYAIQKNFYVEEEKVWSDFYPGLENMHYSLTAELHFDTLLQDGDFQSIVRSTSLLNDAMDKIVAYIKDNKTVVQDDLKQIRSNDEEFGSLSTSNSERNKVTFRFVFKKPNATIEELIENIQQSFSKYAVKLLKQAKEKNRTPDLVIRLKNYISEQSGLEATQQVFDFIAGIKDIKRYEQNDPTYGTDYEFHVTTEEGSYEFFFPKTYEESSDASFLSAEEVLQIRNIFFDANLVWD